MSFFPLVIVLYVLLFRPVLYVLLSLGHCIICPSFPWSLYYMSFFPGSFYYMDLQLSMQSVPITTDVVSSNLDQGEVYNIM